MVFFKVFLLDNWTYRALWAELPHLNSLHEADVVLGEEVRGSWLFCAFKIHKFNSRHHVYAHWQQCLQCLDRIKNKGQNPDLNEIMSKYINTKHKKH